MLLNFRVVISLASMIFGIRAMSLDYYFERSLRSEMEDCSTEYGSIVCTASCGKHISLCSEDGSCYCQYFSISLFNQSYLISYAPSPLIMRRNLEQSASEEVALEDETLQTRPVLRHHIAHFCPDLDIARQCIRKCMKKALPAFCNKDFVCSCGHRYTPHDKDIKRDPNAVNMEFKDLYEKYFGPQHGKLSHGDDTYDSNDDNILEDGNLKESKNQLTTKPPRDQVKSGHNKLHGPHPSNSKPFEGEETYY